MTDAARLLASDETWLPFLPGTDIPDFPCVHGHFDCATSEGGQCSDEHRVVETDSDHWPHDQDGWWACCGMTKADVLREWDTDALGRALPDAGPALRPLIVEELRERFQRLVGRTS